MKYIFDKIIILLLSLVTFGKIRSAEDILIALLFVILYISSNSFFETKRMSVISSIIYAFIMPIFPNMICFIPLVVIEAMLSKCWYILVFTALSGIYTFSELDSDGFFLAKIIMVCVFSMYLVINSYNKINNERAAKKIRDDSYEKSLFLEKNNKILTEKQNYEVYAATLKERNRIAREIHDNVGHVITRSILQIGALMTIYKEEPLHGQLESIKNNMDIAMNTIRESVHDLHDEAIDMKHVIGEIVDELKTKFDVKFEYDISKNTDKKYKYAIIGIVKEASSNIIKHSSNSNVNVLIREHPSMYQIVVHDYCFNNRNEKKDFEAYNGDGIGLSNIKDRVESLNGILRIDTSNGFKVFATIPKKE